MPYKKEVINPLSGKRLKEELKKRGFTHSSFSELVELDPKVIGHICQGKRRLTEKRAEEFAKILNVRPEYLLGLDDDHDPDHGHDLKTRIYHRLLSAYQNPMKMNELVNLIAESCVVDNF